MASLVPPGWNNLNSSILAPWAALDSAQMLWMKDTWGRVQLKGELTYSGGDPPDGSPMLLCPAGTAPSYPFSLVAVEDVIPARFYRIDVGTDGNVRIRYPLAHSTGHVILDSITWVASATTYGVGVYGTGSYGN